LGLCRRAAAVAGGVESDGGEGSIGVRAAGAIARRDAMAVACAWCAPARREAHAVNANGVPSSSPGLFRSNEITLGPSHPTKPPTLKGLNHVEMERGVRTGRCQSRIVA